MKGRQKRESQDRKEGRVKKSVMRRELKGKGNGGRTERLADRKEG